jgi:predicted lysophospholipase L1 biosynthesis ABC-type transport system permease subunit
VEYALVGLVAGTLGVVGATVMSWMVIRYGFDFDWVWHPGAMAAGMTVTIVLSVLAGLAASTRALAVSPLAVLRQGE